MALNRYLVKEIIQEEFLYELAFKLKKINIAASYYLDGLKLLKSLESTGKQEKEPYLLKQLNFLVPYFWSGTKYKTNLSIEEKHKIEQIWRDFNQYVNHHNTATIKPGLTISGRPQYMNIQ